MPLTNSNSSRLRNISYLTFFLSRTDIQQPIPSPGPAKLSAPSIALDLAHLAGEFGRLRRGGYSCSPAGIHPVASVAHRQVRQPCRIGVSSLRAAAFYSFRFLGAGRSPGKARAGDGTEGEAVVLGRRRVLRSDGSGGHFLSFCIRGLVSTTVAEQRRVESRQSRAGEVRRW